MRIFSDVNYPKVVKLLNNGSVGVLRTDTIYGLVARADNEHAVQRIYKLKDRDNEKSPIVLIASTEQMFDTLTTAQQSILDELWPGKVSIILPSQQAPIWIRRDNDSTAYRLPADEKLIQLLYATGPLIAPSANPQAQEPARTIHEAESYFGDKVDFYIDAGPVVDNTPSQLLRLSDDGSIERLR